jgi:hypothetical protein
MSVFGPNPTAAQSLAGLNQAEGVNSRNPGAKKTTKPDGRKREADAVELDVDATQAADAVRNLKSNGDEETTDDRQEQDKYTPQKDKPEDRPHLDVQG